MVLIAIKLIATTMPNSGEKEMKNKNIARLVGASAHALTSRQPNDYYATDPSALQGLRTAMARDGLALCKNVWEPACGEGNLSIFLISQGYEVFATDLIDYNGNHTFDFLSEGDNIKWCGDILTNPPYKIGSKVCRTKFESYLHRKASNHALAYTILGGSSTESIFPRKPTKICLCTFFSYNDTQEQ